MKDPIIVKKSDVLDKLPQALAGCLENVPRSSVDTITRGVQLQNGSTADLIVAVKVMGRGHTLVVEVKSSGQPMRAREAAHRLRRIIAGSGLRGAYPVLAAPYISEASAGICREYEVGYIDLSGNCRFAFDNVYVERVSPENKHREQRGRASLFAPKSSRIIRLMLGETGAWQVQQLAAQAEVSIGLVSKVKQELQEREWLVSTEGRIKLSDPEQVLKAWAEAYSYKKNSVREYYTMMSSSDSEAAVARWCEENGTRYALTGFSAARLSSPRVRYNRSTIYVESKIEDLVNDTDLKPVDTGGNVLLLSPYDEGVFQGSRNLYGMWVVSPPQLYLDLQSMPGRGEEAAEKVLERELRPLW